MGPASPVGQALFIASLSFLAGMTDAIGLLSAGSFVSFMSGNTTNLGVALSALDGRHAAWLGAVLALFVLGGAIGEIVHQRAARPPDGGRLVRRPYQCAVRKPATSSRLSAPRRPSVAWPWPFPGGAAAWAASWRRRP
ncbi:YoaK family protein [Bordetella flabilis]|uniref:DUF1275 family protein n=1 Tax=Bordetella flabilis TaxID=463014 RepID=UPI000A078A6F